MGLAQPHGPVQEQRVVGAGGSIGHGQRSGMGELVAGPGDEVVERVLAVQDDVGVLQEVLMVVGRRVGGRRALDGGRPLMAV